MQRRLFLFQTLGVLGLSTACSSPEAEPQPEAPAATLNEAKLEEAAAHIQEWVDDGKLTAASLTVGRGDTRFARGFGTAKDNADTIFLLASITKPMTAVSLMVLADRGELALGDPVQKFIPEFTGDGREKITIKDVLCHTSGLPDQLPENVELRKRHAPLEEFVERAIKTPLLFEPGTEQKYQSMGTLLASEVAQRITKKPFREFLKEVLFTPLGMSHSALGLGDFKIPETAQSQMEEAPALYGGGNNPTWDWNSLYWRDLGAPWGGAHSTGSDLTKMLEYFLDPDDRVLKPETARSMLVNQNGELPPWGIGFDVAPDSFAKGCSDRTFGHSGSTGTLFWADPETKLTFVMLTTLPARVSREPLINPVSDMVSEAIAANA